MNGTQTVARSVNRVAFVEPSDVCPVERRSRLRSVQQASRHMNETQELILPSVARGDRLAVQRCISRYGALVWSLARRLSPTPADAEDAVQEIFVDLWKSAARYDATRAPERVFVTLIARRRLIDRRRSMRTRLGAETPLEPEHFDSVPVPAGDEGHADAATARSAFKTLPADHQKIIELSLLEGYSHGDIAQKTGVPLGTVKTIIRRGMLKVRAALESAPSREKLAGEMS
jgi:RNA polymerase sigma-70 factor (ECF subfamily)